MIFCTENFKHELGRLCHKNSYKDLQKEIIHYFFDKKTEEIISGTRLNNDNARPYIKKRLAGSGGYRVYYLVHVSKGDIYLMFVHPKTGSEGYENIKDDYKTWLHKDLFNSIQNNSLYILTHTSEGSEILFTKK